MFSTFQSVVGTPRKGEAVVNGHELWVRRNDAVFVREDSLNRHEAGKYRPLIVRTRGDNEPHNFAEIRHGTARRRER